MARLSCCAAAALSLLLLSSPSHAAKTAPNPFKPGNTLECACSDVDPRTYFTKADVQFSCLEQAQFGQCDLPFMRETQEEISEGYCQISCGRCDCCKSLGGVLEERGFKSFLRLLRSTDAARVIDEPGWMATLLAPHDKAVDDAIASLGFGSLDEALSKGRDKVEALARIHILPPVPVTRALWTHPFFSTGLKLPTAQPDGSGWGVELDVRRTDDGKVEMRAQRSSGWIYEADIYACKGYVQAIGTALLP